MLQPQCLQLYQLFYVGIIRVVVIFLQKLLEKTKQRREQLQAKLQQSTPSSAAKKRKPLQPDTATENVVDSSDRQHGNLNIELQYSISLHTQVVGGVE